MRQSLMAGIGVALFALPAIAQTTPPSPATTTPPPAVTATNPPAVTANSSTMPMAADKQSANGGMVGANSFTESQARGRLEKDGFSDVSALAKDQDGIWRGKAKKDAHEFNVGVDYKGNIVTN